MNSLINVTEAPLIVNVLFILDLISNDDAQQGWPVCLCFLKTVSRNSVKHISTQVIT